MALKSWLKYEMMDLKSDTALENMIASAIKSGAFVGVMVSSQQQQR